MITISDLSCLQIANQISQIFGGEVRQSVNYWQASYVSNGKSSWYTYKTSNPNVKTYSLKISDLKKLNLSASDLNKFLSKFLKWSS